MKLNANNELEYKILHVIYEGGNIINLFDINLAKIFSIISLERFQNDGQLEFNLEVQLDNRERGVIYNE